MEATASRKLNCQICGRAFLPQNGAIGDNVRPSLAEFIKSQRPNWDPQEFICFGDLGAFRRDYVKHTLECEIGELTALDHEVIESLREHEVLPRTSRNNSSASSPLANICRIRSRSSAGVGNSSSLSAASSSSG